MNPKDVTIDSTSLKEYNLTPTEMMIIPFIAQGFDHDKIANVLCRTKKTVEFHTANIRKKIKVKKTIEIVGFARKMKLI